MHAARATNARVAGRKNRVASKRSRRSRRGERIADRIPVSWRVNYKSLDFKSVLVSIPFLAVVAMLLRRSRRREVGDTPSPQWRERLSIPLATAPVAGSAY